MKLVGERTMKEQEVKQLVAKFEAGEMSKAAAIREMFAGGLSVKEISSESGIRYNHVYNVVRNEVLVKGLEDEIERTGRNSANSKKNQIIALLNEGKTLTEVSQELKVLYNYVWQVAKGAGLTGKQVGEKTGTEG